jgi:hypothetical protein
MFGLGPPGRRASRRRVALNLLAACLKRADAVQPGRRVGASRPRRRRAGGAATSGARGASGALHGVPSRWDLRGRRAHHAGAPAWATRTPRRRRRSRRCAARGRCRGQARHTPFAISIPRSRQSGIEHTPGGLQRRRGIAARMVPLALGSPAVGSVLRPAAYCGVVGLKPPRADQRGGRARAGGQPGSRGSLRAGGGGLRARPAVGAAPAPDDFVSAVEPARPPGRARNSSARTPETSTWKAVTGASRPPGALGGGVARRVRVGLRRGRHRAARRRPPRMPTLPRARPVPPGQG